MREVGRVLHCPMCRVGSAISATTDTLRQRHGEDVVSEAMRLALSERDLDSAAALEASRTQEPRATSVRLVRNPLVEGLPRQYHADATSTLDAQ